MICTVQPTMFTVAHCTVFRPILPACLLQSNANAIALFLEDHKAVTKVLYPGLKSHPQHDIATRQQNGYGAMITFYCAGGRKESGIILQNVSSSSQSKS